MMRVFKKRGALTHFQILSEISKQDPHLKQKDLAEKLGITIQAVSENIKTLIELGYISSKDGRSPYKITQSGIDKVKKDAITLRKYSDSVLETMNHYKTIWPAIAKENLQKDESYKEAIISKEDFERAKRAINATKGSRVVQNDYLFKGLLRCYDCKGYIGIRSPDKNGNIYGRCQRYGRFGKFDVCSPHNFNYQVFEVPFINIIVYSAFLCSFK